MKRIMIAAMGSGEGKTVLTCALLKALKQRKLFPAAFKCGPDYIDPMFHRRVLGIPGGNLDFFLQGDEGVRRTLAEAKADLIVIEAAMGYYDGVNGTEAASAWHLAAEEDIPVLLVIRPRGSSLTLAAQVRGLMTFREPGKIRALFLSDCRPGLYAHLRPILERETGLPVIGCLPSMEEAWVGSRHLGLITAEEVPDFDCRMEKLAAELERNADLDLLLSLMEDGKRKEEAQTGSREKESGWGKEFSCRIAVAKDEAFCFYYKESLESLERHGARLVPFSPIRDASLPPGVGGLYLGGGYPELYADVLAGNVSMRRSIKEAVENKMPVVAECGGFLYLQRSLKDARGRSHAMAGVFPGEGFPAGRLVRFGYAWLEAEEESLLFRKGEKIPVHEFHHWDCTEGGKDLMVKKPSGASWRCGRVSRTFYAAFPHLHLGGEVPLAERFVGAAREYGGSRSTYKASFQEGKT